MPVRGRMVAGAANTQQINRSVTYNVTHEAPQYVVHATYVHQPERHVVHDVQRLQMLYG